MRRGRLIAGSVLIGISLLPLAVAPVVPFLQLSFGSTAALIGALLAGHEVFGWLAVLVLGREAWPALYRRWSRRRGTPVAYGSSEAEILPGVVNRRFSDLDNPQTPS